LAQEAGQIRKHITKTHLPGPCYLEIKAHARLLICADVRRALFLQSSDTVERRWFITATVFTFSQLARRIIQGK